MRTSAARLIPAHAGKTSSPPATTTATSAHPRSRGENVSRTKQGSSQLTRGKRQGLGVRGANGGFIPAHAGKTWDNISSAVSSAAHPRSRGENGRLSSWSTRTVGSSPLTRGKRNRPSDHRRKRRLIPAHAGKTGASTSTTAWTPPHPRSRGENEARSGRGQPNSGSSPLTRGKPRRQSSA